MRNRIVGIDLGTTYSCIAQVDEHGKAVVLPNSEGELTTPSVVYFESTNNVVVGQAAKEAVSIRPDLCASFVKRVMGDPHWERTFHGESYRPQDISSFILRKVVGDAENITGDKIKDVVITCPAYFGANEKEATKQAGILAGLNVLYVISEPTAATLAYGIEQDQIILVYDLGGATFDISLFEIKSGEITFVCTAGDHYLGGRDWDDAIVSYFTAKFEEATGIAADALLEDMETYQELLNSAERYKRILSSRTSVIQAVRFGGERVKIELTREIFNQITAQYLERTLSLTDQELEKALQKGYTKIDKLLLVGGSTYMPQVIASVKKRFPFEVCQFDPNQAVAKGAAIFGFKCSVDEQIRVRVAEQTGRATDKIEIIDLMMQERAQTKLTRARSSYLPGLRAIAERKIVNVTSKSFGVILTNLQGCEVVQNLIQVNDPLPKAVTLQIRTPSESSQMAFHLMENLESSSLEVDPSVCMELGRVVLSFGRLLPKNSALEISVSLAPDGLLTIEGKDLTAGREVKAYFRTDAVVPLETEYPWSPLGRDQVFISYSHKDRKFLEELISTLSPLLRKGFSVWEDRNIETGDQWRKDIERALASAKVAVLLVSRDFLESDFIVEIELPSLLKAAKQNGLKIIWVLLRPCLHDESEIHRYQAAHDISKPLSKLRRADREALWAQICRQIKQAAQSFHLTVD